MYEKEITEISEKCGASLIGFCDLKDNYCKQFPLYHYAVSIAVKLSDTVLKTITDKPSIIYFQHYRTVNTKLDLIALEITDFIEKKGYSALPIAASQSKNDDRYSGVYQHKTACVMSGLGYIGKSGLLLTEKFGSKVRLATVLTDMPLISEKSVIKNGCGDCDICCKACPAGAISGVNYRYDGNRDEILDAEKCSRYMKEKFQNIGRGSVCGICIKVCPKNKLI